MRGGKSHLFSLFQEQITRLCSYDSNLRIRADLKDSLERQIFMYGVYRVVENHRHIRLLQPSVCERSGAKWPSVRVRANHPNLCSDSGEYFAQCHDADLGTGAAAEARALDDGCRQRPTDHIEHPRQHLRTRREQQSQRPRERQHPSTDRYAREYKIDQVRGSLGSGSCFALPASMQSSTMRRAPHDGQEPRHLQRKKNGGVTAAGGMRSSRSGGPPRPVRQAHKLNDEVMAFVLAAMKRGPKLHSRELVERIAAQFV